MNDDHSWINATFNYLILTSGEEEFLCSTCNLIRIDGTNYNGFRYVNYTWYYDGRTRELIKKISCADKLIKNILL